MDKKNGRDRPPRHLIIFNMICTVYTLMPDIRLRVTRKFTLQKNGFNQKKFLYGRPKLKSRIFFKIVNFPVIVFHFQALKKLRPLVLSLVIRPFFCGSPELDAVKVWMRMLCRRSATQP